MSTKLAATALALSAAVSGCGDGWLAMWLQWREEVSEGRPPRGPLCDGHRKHVRGHCVCDSGFVSKPEERWACVPEPTPTTDERLVVADATDKRLYIYDVATRALRSTSCSRGS